MVAGVVAVIVMFYICYWMDKGTPQSVKDEKDAPDGMFKCKACREFKVEHERANPHGSKCMTCWVNS